MWKKTSQYKIRVFCGFLFFGILIGLLFYQLKYVEKSFSRQDIKFLLTRATLLSETWPPRTFYLAMIGGIPFLLIGVQTYIVMFFFTIFFGPQTSLMYAIFGQSFCSLIILALRKRYGRPPDWQPEADLKRMDELEKVGMDFCFWPRFFQKLSPRTHDWLVGIYVIPKRGVLRPVLILFMAQALRISLQQFLLTSSLYIASDFRPFPEQDLAQFFGSCGVLLFLYIWSLTPEFLPGCEACKLFLGSTIEDPQKAGTSNLNPLSSAIPKNNTQSSPQLSSQPSPQAKPQGKPQTAI
ncbi:MAG: hypothetical protein HQM08_11270 [Candidatus Riflebacteria bacterium]|nr:hypothetical protein [Candidatus Riflebacteria bacterium]